MDNNFEKIIDIIIAIIIFFLFPLIYFSQRQETILQQVVTDITDNFANNVNAHGVLTEDMYQDFLSRLDGTNLIYKINLEHKKSALEPEYRLRTADEVIDEQNNAYTGTNTYHYFPVSTDLPVVVDPVDNSGLVLNTETNESILEKAVHTSASGSHVHTYDCYLGDHEHGNHVLIEGHVHIDSCYCNGHVSTKSWSSNGYGGYYGLCDVCGQTYESNTYTDGQRCTKLICGLVNGQYYNCYAGKVKIIFDSTSGPTGGTYGYKMECAECGETLFGIYQSYNNFFPSDNTMEFYKFTGGNNPASLTRLYINANPLLYSEVQKYFNDINSLVSTYGSVIPAGKFTLNIPYFGQLNGCEFCNDYKISIDSNSSYEIRCMKCNQVVARSFYYPYYMVAFYKNGAVDTMISNTDEAKAIVVTVQSIFYGTYTSNSWKYQIIKELNTTHALIGADDKLFTDTLLSNYSFHGCNYGLPIYCNAKGELKCHDIVKSIVPTHPVQTVYVGEPLITTATATYMDGSTGIVLCSADFEPISPVKDKIVTLSYVNLKKQTLNCIEKVTVIPKTKICENGHVYNLNNDGSDPGCPYCKAWLKSLELYHPSEGNLTIYRGTSLEENGVILLATYLDGHKEYVTTGYANNLDKYYIGIQDVTISYKGKNVSLLVTVKRNIIQCPVCHHWYELYPDDSDPGCPYCKSRTPVFTGNILHYYSEIFTKEILKEIFEGSGSYYMKTGDYFSVKVSNRSETLGNKILGFIHHDLPKITILAEKGGIVRDDMDAY